MDDHYLSDSSSAEESEQSNAVMKTEELEKLDFESKISYKVVVNELRSVVLSNPYDWNAAMQFIKKLRRKLDILYATEQPSDAMDQMLNEWRIRVDEAKGIFVLPSNIWLDIMNETIRLYVDNEDLNFVFSRMKSVMDDAVFDGYMIDVWFVYLKKLSELMKSHLCTEDFAVSVKEEFERCLSFCALDPIKGPSIFKMFAESFPEKKIEVLRRQLSIPHISIEDTANELQQFDNNVFQISLSEMQKRMEFEEEVFSAEPPFEENNWTGYIQYELKQGDPSRIRNVFERSLQSILVRGLNYNVNLPPYLPEIAKSYMDYLKEKLNLSNVIVPISKRLVKMFPEMFYKDFIQIAEMHVKSVERLDQIFDELKLHCADLCSLGVEYLKGVYRLSKLLEKKMFFESVKQRCVRVKEAVGNLDVYGTIDLFFAHTASQVNDLDTLVLIMEELLKEKSKESWYWLEYQRLLQQLGSEGESVKKRRAIYSRALNASTDKHSVASEWIRFEETEGTIDKLWECERRCKSAIEEQQKLNELKEAKEAQKKQKTEMVMNENKRKLQENLKSQKHPKPSDSASENSQTRESTKLKESGGTERCNRTVFLSNLPYDASEDKIKSFFVKPDLELQGYIQNIRLNQRGFAYIEFDNIENASKALLFDRHHIDNRMIYVSPYKTEKRAPKQPQPVPKTTNTSQKIIPRQIKKKKAIQVQETSPSNEEKEAKAEVKTNDDFRKLFYQS